MTTSPNVCIASAPDQITQGRLPALDGLRGIAIILVFFFHLNLFLDRLGGYWAPLGFVASLGWTGVDLFFVLSGFLITGILIDTKSDRHHYRNFYIRRTLRIFPLYYLGLVAVVVIMPVIFSKLAVNPGFNQRNHYTFWLYGINWMMAFSAVGLVPVTLHHFWSLCIEEQFYLVWPFCIRPLKPKWAAVFAGSMIFSAFVLRLMLSDTRPRYVLPYCRMDDLAAGALLAVTFRIPSLWGTVLRVSRCLGLLSAIVFIGLLIARKTTDFGDIWVSSIGFTCLAFGYASILASVISANPSGLGHSLLSSSVLRFFGKYSYGLYIVHQPIMVLINTRHITGIFNRITGNEVLTKLLMDLTALAVAIGFALVSWHVLEAPILRWKDKLAPRGRKSVAT